MITVADYHPQELDQKWQAHWAETGAFEVTEDPSKPKFYCLEMFAYPSGHAHVGHVRNYIIGDVVARLKRLQGFNVLHPFGWDAFGLPAENAAIKGGIHPETSTLGNIAHMKGQLQRLGISYAWGREIATCLPDYYRWNQWLFLRMLERGLAYRRRGAVWWCPQDQTVLANEQVLEGNICERCGAEVFKRDLEQWYFRITDYAEELLHDAETLDWPERVKTMQRKWIGRSEGARLRFMLETGDALQVFTTRPDTVWGATFMVLAPEHPLVAKITTPDRQADVDAYIEQARRQTEIERMSTDEARARTGVFTGGYAVNPVTDERIPVWIADYVLMGYGTGAIMAVPFRDQRHFEFARAFDLPIRAIVQPATVNGGTRQVEPLLDPTTMTEAYAGPGVLVNSGLMTGKRVPEELPEIIRWLEETGRG